MKNCYFVHMCLIAQRKRLARCLHNTNCNRKCFVLLNNMTSESSMDYFPETSIKVVELDIWYADSSCFLLHQDCSWSYIWGSQRMLNSAAFHSIPGRPFPFVKVCHLLCMGRRCNLYKWLVPETCIPCPLHLKKRPGIERQFDQSYLAAGRQIQGRVSYTRSEDAF